MRSESLIKYRMRRLESPQEPPDSFLLLVFIRKSDRTHLKKDQQTTSLYLSALVPPSVSNISRYSLRNSNDLQTIDARTTLYYNSFLPSTVRAWNNVNDEAKQSNSVNTFKCFLNKDKTRIPKHFYVGSRKAEVLHTRLRTNCSSLNLDLFLKNISDSPLCRCGSVENAQHYFFTAGIIRFNESNL